MKKIILSLMLLLSLRGSSQILDTVSVSITLRAQDWAWAIGKFGSGNDSITIVKVRAIRDAIRIANPPSWTTNVTINSVPGKIVYGIYRVYSETGFLEIFAMGNTAAERATIYTNIHSINNAALQYFIGLWDGVQTSNFIQLRDKGKHILMDN